MQIEHTHTHTRTHALLILKAKGKCTNFSSKEDFLLLLTSTLEHAWKIMAHRKARLFIFSM